MLHTLSEHQQVISSEVTVTVFYRCLYFHCQGFGFICNRFSIASNVLFDSCVRLSNQIALTFIECVVNEVNVMYTHASKF